MALETLSFRTTLDYTGEATRPFVPVLKVTRKVLEAGDVADFDVLIPTSDDDSGTPEQFEPQLLVAFCDRDEDGMLYSIDHPLRVEDPEDIDPTPSVKPPFKVFEPGGINYFNLAPPNPVHDSGGFVVIRYI